jgi:hypothetical protein
MLIDPSSGEIIQTYEPGSYGNPEEDQGGGSAFPYDPDIDSGSYDTGGSGTGLNYDPDIDSGYYDI